MAEPVKGVEERFAEREAELFGGPPPVLPLPGYAGLAPYILGFIIPLAGAFLGAIFLTNKEESVQRIGRRTLILSSLGTIVLVIRMLIEKSWMLTILG